LKLYNTLSKRLEDFTPVSPPKVGMYVCGPTVYSDAHIGHAKSYVTFDVLRRYLIFLGYDVTYVQNITDVGHLTDDADEGEDKLIVEGRKRRIHPMQIAATFTRHFREDMARMNVLPPDIEPLASGHIIEQIEIIKTLISKGFAYEIGGNVYFDVTKDPDYGKLSGRKIEDQEESGRVEKRSDKRNPQDFALWKKAEPEHIMQWSSPWGKGFPGWHIECSAMSMKYLGETIDIHGGGLENQFPHHECEIAQSESATGRTFVRYWLHHNMVTVDGKKMGKSLGNSSYLRDLFNEFDPMTLRFFLLQSHYRSTTEFNVEAIRAAETGYKRLLAAYERIRQMSSDNGTLTDTELHDPLMLAFIGEMNEDINTPKAIAVTFDAASEANKLSSSDTARIEQLGRIMQTILDILGILPLMNTNDGKADAALDSLVQMMIGWRNDARAAKDFSRSDMLRDALTKAGIVVEDGKQSTDWHLE
jgi:cysteinyl-tRNA synthetase